MTTALKTPIDVLNARQRLPVGCLTVKLAERSGRERLVSVAVDGAADSRLAGVLGPLQFEATLDWHVEYRRLQVELTVHNPRRARHREGFWDLGDPGSVLLRGLCVEVPLSGMTAGDHTGRKIEWIEHAGGDVHQTTGEQLEIYQESSGGENWNSRNHVNRNDDVPMQFRGYRVRTASDDHAGLRANPVVAVTSGETYVACALEEFWQQFPSALEVDEQRICVWLWPQQFSDLHELQAGEKNTRVVWLQFGDEGSPRWQTLQDVHDPAPPPVDREALVTSGVAPFLPSADSSVREECRVLLYEALEGERHFFAKREVIDEYGWRNFGDMWADHEEAYCDDAKPVVSHYNNQYDLLYGLLVQYVLTEDVRWWRLADPLARHILDIDIYHTDHDKPAYDGGLFWHTNHYHHVGRCTHRSYSESMRGKKMPATGGGPANEHNYSTGLLLYHQLTGNRRAREAVLSLADWVIAMDDGRRHVLGVLSPQPTGSASSTAMTDYHGPGRGVGNSINVLLDGWLTGRDDKYLHKAEELIRRTIHPLDDVAALELDNAELRWSYTVSLQALFRFLELTKTRDDLNPLWCYCRESLLHYARWMAEHESFYLDRPERLDFPTETWAAQELRKGVVLWMAAAYSEPDQREALISRGRELLDGSWQRLMRFGTRDFTRPLALVLQQCYLESYLVKRIAANAGTGAIPSSQCEPQIDFVPQNFVPQKRVIRQQANSLGGIAGLMWSLLQPRRWTTALRQFWVVDRIRSTLSHIVPGKKSRILNAEREKTLPVSGRPCR